MQINFFRHGDGHYHSIVVRDDGVKLRVPGPDRADWLPHDIAHYVVERALELRHGFWGCVAAGAVYSNLEVIGGRLPPHAAARSQAVIRAAGQRGTEAEVLVGIFAGITHDRLDPRGPVALARVANAWRDPGNSRSPHPTPTQIEEICLQLEEARQLWQALPVGKPLTFEWNMP